jgi:hypothetical protein
MIYDWNLLLINFLASKAKRMDFIYDDKDCSIYWVVDTIRIDIKKAKLFS